MNGTGYPRVFRIPFVFVSTEKTPPSRNSSEGGVGGGLSTDETPPSRNSREGGVGGVLTKETSPPSHVSSEGGVC